MGPNLQNISSFIRGAESRFYCLQQITITKKKSVNMTSVENRTLYNNFAHIF